MPLLREIRPAEGIHAGIWQITETDRDLADAAVLGPSDREQSQAFRNDRRRKQWLACRALLKSLLPGIKEPVIYDSYGKPHFPGGLPDISISHAGDFAAAVYSRDQLVGIDIEQMRDRVERVRDRFLLPEEIDGLDPAHRLEHLYLYWCGKEALYKIHGKPDLDFRTDIHIHPFDYLCHTIHTARATLKGPGQDREYDLYFERLGDYMLAIAW